MTISKEVKVGIVSSLTASLIFVLLQPLLAIVWTLIKGSSINYYSGFVDSIYRRAAIGQTDELPFMIIYIIILASFVFVFVLFRATVHRYKKIKNIIHETNEVEINTSHERAAKLVKTGKYIINFGYLFIPVWAVSVFFFLLKAFVVMQLIASFNQRLTAITPYIDIETEKKIKSEWALMKTVKDFQKIDSQISAIGNQSKIELPKDLLN